VIWLTSATIFEASEEIMRSLRATRSGGIPAAEISSFSSVLQIVLARATDLDNLRRHSD